jgi:hypothetical protein
MRRRDITPDGSADLAAPRWGPPGQAVCRLLGRSCYEAVDHQEVDEDDGHRVERHHRQREQPEDAADCREHDPDRRPVPGPRKQHMRAQRSGLVVAITSTAGIMGQEFCTAYAASKFGVEGWTESLTPEVAPFGIRTMLVEPSFFRTELLTPESTTVRGRLHITGRRIDAEAPPLRSHVPDYGLTGFQSTAVTFPTVGCWEVTGRVASQTSLTFVTSVTLSSSGASRSLIVYA